MAVVAAMITIGWSCPLLSLTSPQPKASPTPTKTAKPSASPTPSLSPTPMDTATPAATSAPTEMPTVQVQPADTPTHTMVPPTSTARPPTATPAPEPPSPSPTPSWAYEYLEGSMEQYPNCGSVYLEGEITNQREEPKDGVTVRLRWWDNVEYELSGLAGGHSPGKWGFSPLSPDQNRAHQPFILDIVESGANPVPLSEELHVNMVDCSQAGQFINITFVSMR